MAAKTTPDPDQAAHKASKMSKKEWASQKKRAEAHHLTALVFGYNEMARLTNVLGEKVYFRLCRDRHAESLKELGHEIAMNHDAVVVTLGVLAPSINLYEKDIEMMRQAVAAWDAAHMVPPAPTPPTPWSRWRPSCIAPSMGRRWC